MLNSNSNIIYIPKPNHSQFRDLAGQRFGRLTVLGLIQTTPTTKWHCQCECGNKAICGRDHLLDGTTQSCGCYMRQRARDANTIHGESGRNKQTPEFRAYVGARSRCANPNVKSYKDYGGRGIEFRFDSFEAFLTEVGRKPSTKHSLDRKNVDGHYEKGNLQWATKQQQARNTRANKMISYNSETLCQSDWAKRCGISPAAIIHRIKKGWCVPCVVTLSKKQECLHK